MRTISRTTKKGQNRCAEDGGAPPGHLIMAFYELTRIHYHRIYYGAFTDLRGVTPCRADLATILGSYEWLKTTHLASMGQPVFNQFRHDGLTSG